MGLRIGKIRGYEIKKNRDGANNVLLLQVEVSDPDDVQTIEFYQAASQDLNPATDSLVAFLDAGKAWKIALGADDGIVPEKLPGEHKIYSSESGVIKAFIEFLVTGMARMSGLNTEILATEFTKLSSATLDLLASGLAQLKAAAINIIATGEVIINGAEVIINDNARIGSSSMELGGNVDNAVRFSALETAFNQLKSDFDGHTHGGVDTGGGTTSPAITSSADITGAKIDNIKTS
jgi:hypothetical protein